MSDLKPSSTTAESQGWKPLITNKEVISWSFYDWANSAFATTVMAGFFPVFFKQYWSAGTDLNVSTYQLGFANSLSAGILACLSPILGAYADQGSGKKRSLIVFTCLGVIMTGALAMVAKGDWLSAVILYVIANIGFAGGNSFYDSLLVDVAQPKDLHRVSALGYSLGYLGGGVLFALNVLMTLKPHLFGLRDAAHAVQVSFFTVAIWWTVFTLPLLFFVKEDRVRTMSYSRLLVAGLKQVLDTFIKIKSLKNVSLFLLAYFFYIDGVNTIMRMAVDYGLALGLPSESLIVALLLTQFVGFPAALVYGHLAHHIGEKRGIYLAIFIYSAVCVFAYFMTTAVHFYILAIVIGLVQGGIQALSRSVFANMIPKENSGEFFGFFNMLGKFSSMLGPFLVGWVSLSTQSSRASILSIILLFVIGSALLIRVKVPHGHGTDLK